MINHSTLLNSTYSTVQCTLYVCKRPRSYSIEKAVNKHFEHGRENCLPSASYWQVLNWTGIDVPARKIDQNIPIFGRLKGPSSLWSLLGGVESGRGPTEGVFSS